MLSSCPFIVYFFHIYKLYILMFLSFYHFIFPFSFNSILSHVVLFLLCAAPSISFYFLNILYIAYIHFCNRLGVEILYTWNIVFSIIMPP